MVNDSENGLLANVGWAPCPSDLPQTKDSLEGHPTTGHIAAQQRLLVRLYTDESLRDRMASSPNEVLVEYGLAPDEASTWQAMLADIGLFAESLHIKRCAEARALLPMTLAALGRKTFNELFLNFASTFLPTGHRKPHADSVAFGAWLLSRRSGSPVKELWQRDIIEFEHISRSMLFRRIGLITRCLGHMVHLWNPNATPNQPPSTRRTRYVWWSWRSQLQWRRVW